MSVYVASGFTGMTYGLTHGRVCWDAFTGTVMGSTAAAGFPAVNAASVRTDSAWRPTVLPATWTLTFAAPQTVSFIAIAKHDLGTLNATIAVEYDAAGGLEAWEAFAGLGAVQPSDDSPILFLVPATSSDAIRIRITAADGNPTIAVIRAGRADEWPRPFVWTGVPITEGDRISFDLTTSMTGNWLGRSVASDGLQFDLTMNHASEEWRQGAFAAFKRYANGNDAAFFVAPRPANYPNEVAYAWAAEVVTATREIANARISTSVTLRCQGLRPTNV